MATLADLYQEYVVELDPVLWQMGRVNGVPVDNEKRLSLLSEMNAKVQGLKDDAQQYIPDALFPVEHKVKRPDDLWAEKHRARSIREVQVPNEGVKTCAQCGAQHVTKAGHTSRKGGRGDVPLNPCYKAEILLTPGFDTEFDVTLPFNPGSDDQLREYASLFGHKLGRNWKTQQSTLDAKQLQKFIDRYGEEHPLYGIAAQVRKVRKARGYAAAWVPDEKGLLYGTFKHAPETFRLSQSDQNFMNVSHRGDVPYVDELRSLLVAPEGYMMLEADSSSIEAVFTGLFMGNREYMELAKKGIHSWWAAKKLGLEASKDNTKRIKNPDDNVEFWTSQGHTAKEIQVLYETKKRTVHAVSYGMGAGLLHTSYPEFFPATWFESPELDDKGRVCRWCHKPASKGHRHLCPVYTAQREIDEFYALVPDLKAWHADMQKKAHKQGYLQSPWGFRNYYYRVFSYDFKTDRWRLGEDAKAAIAFNPQHANGMFQRKNLVLIHREIDKRGMRGKWWQPANGHVHDSNGLMVPENDVDKAAAMLAEIMNRPIPQMQNIQVGVVVKAGRNWAEMKPVLSI